MKTGTCIKEQVNRIKDEREKYMTNKAVTVEMTATRNEIEDDMVI
jgi:hypothetical protein